MDWKKSVKHIAPMSNSIWSFSGSGSHKSKSPLITKKITAICLVTATLTALLPASTPSDPAYANGSWSTFSISGSEGGALANKATISSDGNTIAWGQTGAGYGGALCGRWSGSTWVYTGSWCNHENPSGLSRIQVRTWNGSAWVDKGSSSLPTAHRDQNMGVWQSLSANGNVIAFSAAGNENGYTPLNRTYVADWNGSTWIQRPYFSGAHYTANISADGNVLMFTDADYDAPGGGADHGQLRVVVWNGSSWTERTPIIGESGSQLKADEISNDGLTISYSARSVGTTDSNNRSVMISTWDSRVTAWVTRTPIVATLGGLPTWGSSSMSADGNVVALGEMYAEGYVGQVRVFDWAVSEWVARPTVASISGASGHFGMAVDISDDGTALAVSAPYFANGRVAAFDWNGSTWIQRGSTFTHAEDSGHYGHRVQFNSDSKILVTGSVYSNMTPYYSGKTDIHRWQGTRSVVRFDTNLGSGSMPSTWGSSPAKLSTSTLSRAGYQFSGWNTSSDGLGTSYADGATYEYTSGITLFAQWTAIVPTPAPSTDSGLDSAPKLTPAPSTDSGLDSAPKLEIKPDLVAETRAKKKEDFPAAISSLLRSALPGPKTNTDSSLTSRPQGSLAAGIFALFGQVNGKAAPVTSTVKNPQTTEYAIGPLKLNLGVAPGNGSVVPSEGQPVLRLTGDTPATIKGSGLEPDSSLKVSLPSASGSAIELPAVNVAADGSFEAALTLESSNRSKPLPIGQQSIQVLGVNEQGKETMLAIPVIIAQPAPAPATSLINGQRPALGPGESSGLNAGDEIPVSTTQSGSWTEIGGEGWSVKVSGTTKGAEPKAVKMERDKLFEVRGSGFMPGTRAEVWLFSTPVLLGTVDILEDGTFISEFLPSTNFVPVGNHTLQIQGVGVDGFVRAANLGVEMADQELQTATQANWMVLMIFGLAAAAFVVLVGVVLALRGGGRRASRAM